MRRVVFELALFQGPEQRIESEAVMRLLLEALVAANVLYLRAHPNTPSIYAGGVRYERETRSPACDVVPGPYRTAPYIALPYTVRDRFGECADDSIPEVWKTIPYILRDGVGDCEDLACARVAELLVQGIQAEPTFRYRPVGQMLVYHILVKHPSGRFEDPSRQLGMGTPDA